MALRTPARPDLRRLGGERGGAHPRRIVPGGRASLASNHAAEHGIAETRPGRARDVFPIPDLAEDGPAMLDALTRLI